MRRVVHLGQVLESHVRVDLGGGDVRVAQLLLRAAQVAGGFQGAAQLTTSKYVVHGQGQVRGSL